MPKGWKACTQRSGLILPGPWSACRESGHFPDTKVADGPAGSAMSPFTTIYREEPGLPVILL